MNKRNPLSKRGIKEYHDLDEKEYKKLDSKGLIPDYTDKAYAKFEELMDRGGPFNFEERFFLGNMDIKQFGEKYPVDVEFFMAD